MEVVWQAGNLKILCKNFAAPKSHGRVEKQNACLQQAGVGNVVCPEDFGVFTN